MYIQYFVDPCYLQIIYNVKYNLGQKVLSKVVNVNYKYSVIGQKVCGILLLIYITEVSVKSTTSLTV